MFRPLEKKPCPVSKPMEVVAVATTPFIVVILALVWAILQIV